MGRRLLSNYLLTLKENKMKGKILIIEDDPNWQNDLRFYFENDGFYVEVVSSLEEGISKIKKELFHFITIDMRLDDDKDINPEQFEGWKLLEVIKKLRVQERTPVMVITGYGVEYKELKNIKNMESLFFMEKGRDFDLKKLLEIVNMQVKRIDLRFNNDFRNV